VARFYAIKSTKSGRYDEDQHVSTEEEASSSSSSEKWKEQIEHSIFPMAKQWLLPPKSLAKNGTFVQIANLPDLYKVFERC